MPASKPPLCPVNLRIVLLAPPAGVAFALQVGSGSRFTLEQRQVADGGDLHFTMKVSAVEKPEQGEPDFRGPAVQGPRGERFVYLTVGQRAHQPESCWERRVKVPLAGITWDLLNSTEGGELRAEVIGTARDGSPVCATQRPRRGWQSSAPR